MADFHFADPDWSYAMWPVAAVVVLIFWLDRRRNAVLTRFLSPAMQARLSHRISRGRRSSSIVFLALAGVSLVVALMRPQWGVTYHEAPRVGAEIMFCLDVSKSMLATDTAPNRLDRAKAELTDLLSYLDGDQVGLIAFAGRAVVLCPLTTDFGFFKLILDGAGPHSVGRGGTRLEEPIRKALDGFRTESDVSRVLVLITDGEDHDSHPLDAAKAAAERGVKIVAIGFGDNAGSKIFLTDPQTGAPTQLRDAAGRPIVTRLDGDTLREMALATGGASIPAGTGSLDLKSIYDAHIAPLVRGRLDDRGQPVRRDVFQWAVLAGLVFLAASIIVGSGRVKAELRSWGAAYEPRTASHDGPADEVPVKTRRAPPRRVASVGTALLVLTAQFAQTPSYAQDPRPAAVDPRDGYNEALAHLDTDFDRAERMLSEARRDAGTDGEVRFRATYNLGWVEVKRAEKLAGEQPQDALAHLHRAADWFRDAVRLRPDESDARHNLDVVLRRIVVLADSLAHNEERNLAQRLDELIEAQRRVVSGARQLVDRVAADADPNAADGLRAEFRKLATQQRKILCDEQSVSRAVREELDALAAQKDEEKSPQDKVRAARLTGLVDDANRAEQRLCQACGQMRRREASRSFRRAAAGLTELERARDRLRGPVEVRDVILADAASLAQACRCQAELNDKTEQAAAGSQSDDTCKKISPLLHRQRELESITRRIAAALREQAKRPPAGDEQQATDPDPKHQCTKAGKLVGEAQGDMEQAWKQLSEASTDARHAPLDKARQHQNAALAKLVEALAVLEPPRPEQQQYQQNQQQQDQKSKPSAGQPKKKPEPSAGFDPSRLLQAVRDREAQRRRHHRDGPGPLLQEPVDKDW